MSVADTPTLLGAEMLEWSDASAGSPVLAELLRRTIPQGARVLVAGPHDADLIDAVAARTTALTCVLRGLPDAVALARRHPDATVYGGDLERIPATASYDVVIALAALDPLTPAGATAPTWDALLDSLIARLAPGGTLLLTHPNPLGLHTIACSHPCPPGGRPAAVVAPERAEGALLPEPRAFMDDAQWPRPVGVRPLTAEALRAALHERGSATVHLYAGYPEPYRPGVLLDLAAADRPEHAALAGTPTTRQVFEAGLGVRLAPAWVAVASFGLAAAVPTPAVPSASPPVTGLVGDGAGRWCVVCEVGSAGRRPVVAGEPMRDGLLSRDPAAVGSVTGGRTLEEALLEACAAADLVAVRGLIAAWAPDSVFATLDNVRADGGRLLDPSWAWGAEVAPEVVVARGIRRFVTRLLEAGGRHPWPRGYDAERICRVLHAMARVPGDAATLEAGLRLEAEICSSTEGVPLEAVLERLRRPGRGAEAPALAQAVDRAAVLEEQRRWLLARLEQREAALAKRERELAAVQAKLATVRDRLRAVRGSTTFRAGRAVTWPARRALRILGR